ncbi:hypothetical protein GCM10007276_03500 [Agaricicola taiwanensis]|uniref:Uncharacterized protein n=2 Tax=Agaricicola taiwanensis TaxID=591372 RepID=A0A8J2VL66_9RHOB|nr:hypothetical protein GCM10007276_03500 [Agaricicola taiwanensis]
MRRMLGFALANAKGNLGSDPELTRMVTEKWAAAFAGASAASAAMISLAAKPDNMIDASAALTRAAVEPTLRQLKRNNRRLRRRRHSA